MRKAGAERGSAQFEPVSWDVAFSVLEQRLAHLRATDPKRFALFTGRDQMQALTGLFAKQYGTPNYAAHGGFCSANMAAGMIYTVGGSFWEFGGPDLDRAKLFFMIGTAEDHHSNPLKIAISKFKRAGGRFVAINPVRTGYAAIADEWVPIRPGTDGALFMAMIRELIETGGYDRDFVTRYTNAAELLDMRAEADTFGLFVRDASRAERNPLFPQNHLWWDLGSGRAVAHHTRGATPALDGRYALDDGTPVAPSFALLRERVAECTPQWAERITGIPAATIRRLAHEMADVARDHKITLPIRWTDAWGETHDTVTGNPVAFHAMRGLAAHSNGFQSIRALAVLMSLLGTIDQPGGFRHKSPYPRAVPPSAKPPNGPDAVRPNTPLAAGPLGWPAAPEDLFVDEQGGPVRIDKAFSWEYPLAVHGLMHSVITNAWRGDPYPIDTLMIFMANMAWNSSMNTVEVRRMLADRHDNGDYKIPFIVVCDAFQSEMTAFADLILPDTTYLERHDAMSMLDRPISEFDGPVDSVRIPVVPPTGECKPFQEVLIELASRLKLPAFTNADGTRKFRDYPDFVINYQTAPDSGVGFLIGWRGEDGGDALVGAPNPRQWDEYEKHGCVFHYTLPDTLQYMRGCNGPVSEMGGRKRFPEVRRADRDPPLLGRAAEIPTRRAGQDERPAAARAPARAYRTTFRSAAVLVRTARARRDRFATLPARGRHAAADGDVSLVGFAERVAAADSWGERSVRESEGGARRGHRRRRLDLRRIAMGQGALPRALQRSGRAGHRLDVERDRQGSGRMESRPGRERIAARLPVEPRDHRRVARRRRARAAHLELRSDHRPGRVVRRARAHLPGRGRRGPHAAAIRADACAARCDGRGAAHRANLFRGARRIRRAAARCGETPLTRRTR
ncbi:molybdopterin oxidoreductase family protein [Burkholderia pseudomallei MSHR684]|nr:molybdopterin oxidoreductase family protein [Burkholderia pseudomallei MSHR684]